ncbi:MAG: sugar ABC transporter permease [Lachnospiraceae bacterium]|jgi:raffinose/stachyose/melibiose transport system permease protein|nr:sugar ABC transporter permease [Lachnospiraceae bacterium]MDY3990418.1 sugar ABC transporter permease [Lachnospiraceae bacterium]
MKRTVRRAFPLFVLPTVAAFFIGFIVPFIWGVYLSFNKFTVVNNLHFVGFKNYVTMFKEGDFGHSLWYTALFTVVSVVTINVLAFLIALALCKKFHGTRLFRTIFFMPNLIGGIVLGYIWQIILNGVLVHWKVTLTTNEWYGFWGLIILMNWQQIGYMMIIYIAGIMSVPQDLIESAMIDGAGSWERLKSVIIPILRPSITICTFLTLTNGFKLFDQNLALTAGNPGKKSEMLALNIYNTFYGRVGYQGVGQAKAVIFTILVAIIAFAQLHFTRSGEEQM